MNMLVGCMLLGLVSAQKPVLIEWGWDQPNTPQMPERFAKKDAIPFDGTILNAVGKEGEGTIDMCWYCFSSKRLTKEQFESSVKDLKAVKRSYLKNSFLRFNVTPGDVQFFDDEAWKIVANNAKVAAWIAKEGRLKGWMFDVEQYNSLLFSYAEQRKKVDKTFEEYQACAKRRGAELIKAVNSEFKNPVILFTFAHAMLVSQRDKLPDAEYGLMPAFIDGMLEAASSKTEFVDSLEMTYPCKTKEDFERFRQLVRVQGRELSSVPEIYDKRMKVGFGIWIDYDWRGRGWLPDSPEKNFFTPDQLRESLKNALKLTDGYVWLYSEKVNWWTGEGLSNAYIQAVRDARDSVK